MQESVWVMDVLSNLPFISPTEFTIACDRLLTEVRTVQNTTWDSAEVKEVLGRTELVVRRPISGSIPGSGISLDQEGRHDVVDEEDTEVDRCVIFLPPSASPAVFVEYSCVLHQTYQVPVLYLTLHSYNGLDQYTIDDIYSLLVPEIQLRHVRRVGVLGAITYGEHPISGVPAFFVHPCNTAEAIRNLGESVQITTNNYLPAWLGLVGPAVGLHLPLPLLLH